MRLHTIYRASGDGSQTKARPTFYSKLRALQSFVNCLRDAPSGERIFVHDGVVPEERVKLAAAQGEIVQLGGVGNAQSYQTCVAIVQARAWSADDLVYLVEDDYLHVAGALSHLALAAAQIPAADYFTLYDSPDYERLLRHRAHMMIHRGARQVDGHHWREVRSTCLTYGARVGALRRDAWLHHLCSRRGAPADYAMWSVLARDGLGFWLPRLMLPASRPDLGRVLRGWVRPEDRPHPAKLYAVAPGLATHLEVGLLSPGVAWDNSAIWSTD